MSRPAAAAEAPARRHGHERTGRFAVLVATGILLSRISGLVRQRFLSHYFGLGDVADAFTAAFRIPNLVRNLFGEGVLSASFIPVYARLLAEDDREGATRVAGAIAALLALITSVVVLIGVLATPWLLALIAPGFTGAKRELTIRLVRIFFPAAGILVMSAWCLGVLNSHRRFFLSYTAPIVWNVAIIVTLVAFGRLDAPRLAVAAAWGAVVGSALMFGVQLPSVMGLLPHLHLRTRLHDAHVRAVVRNFGPVFIGRGVVQISAYVDTLLASLLGSGAMMGLSSAQILYLLPVSLFGMSVSAAELPVMASAVGESAEVVAYLRTRLDAGLRRIAFLVIPSAVAFLALGDILAGALFQTGRFTRADTMYVWAILAGSAVGLLATTLGRLYSSTYYALRDTRTPLRFAVVRVVLTIALGVGFALYVPRLVGLDLKWGAAGLTASAGVAGWLEFLLLRHTLNARIGRTGLAAAFVVKLWAAALAGAAAAWGVKLTLGTGHPIVLAIAALIPYGLIYFGVAELLGVPEARTVVRAALRRG